jgi:hypothetical protein
MSAVRGTSSNGAFRYKLISVSLEDIVFGTMPKVYFRINDCACDEFDSYSIYRKRKS